MRRIIKSISSLILIPLTKWYLRKERAYTRDGINIRIKPGVFHPGLFSSTGIMYEFITQHDLNNKSFLELGCGSGFLSIAAARAGAIVTASDISMPAVKNTKENAFGNHTAMDVRHSDLFENIDRTKSDWIVINPPYYARTPVKEEDLAWYCGENFEYFQKLFSCLKDYVHENTQVIMVLTLGCDLQQIFSIANHYGFQFELLKEKRVLFDEKDFLYRIKAIPDVDAGVR